MSKTESAIPMIGEMWERFAEGLPANAHCDDELLGIIRSTFYSAISILGVEQHELLFRDGVPDKSDPDELHVWLEKFMDLYIKVQGAWEAELGAANAICRIQSNQRVFQKAPPSASALPQALAFDVRGDLELNAKRMPTQLVRDEVAFALIRIQFISGYVTVLQRLRDFLRDGKPSVEKLLETVEANMHHCKDFVVETERRRVRSGNAVKRIFSFDRWRR